MLLFFLTGTVLVGDRHCSIQETSKHGYWDKAIQVITCECPEGRPDCLLPINSLLEEILNRGRTSSSLVGIFMKLSHTESVYYKPLVGNQLTVQHLPNTPWEQYVALFRQREDKCSLTNTGALMESVQSATNV